MHVFLSRPLFSMEVGTREAYVPPHRLRMACAPRVSDRPDLLSPRHLACGISPGVCATTLLAFSAPSLSPSVSRHVPSVHSPRSPGNKNPAVLAYDPTGLRSAMSATNQELEKALDRAMPNHNVRYAWQAEEEQIVKDCEAKGLPVPPGKRAKFAVPAMATQRRW